MLDFILGIFKFLQAIPIIITVCSAIVMMTPTPVDDKLWAKVYKWIGRFALNIGKAKDKNPLLD